MKDRNKNQKPHRHILRITAGILFLILGIIGLFLPILQGILFLMISIGLLAPYVPFLRKLQLMLYKRYPGLRRKINTLKKRHRKKGRL